MSVSSSSSEEGHEKYWLQENRTHRRPPRLNRVHQPVEVIA